MKKKSLITLLLALFIIAGSWAQKNRDNYYGGNDRNGNYRKEECHSNGNHYGKHKKEKKHKHHGHDDWEDYGHQQGGCKDRDHDYDYNGRDRGNDRNDNWSNRNSTPIPSTRPARDTRSTPTSVQSPASRRATTAKQKQQGSAKTVQYGTSRTAGSTSAMRRPH